VHAITGNGNYANLLKSILEKFVKAHQVNLILAGFSHLKPLCGSRHDVKEASEKQGKYVEIAYHESLLAELALSHAVHDFCIIGNYNT
jgi:hypothetical protein